MRSLHNSLPVERQRESTMPHLEWRRYRQSLGKLCCVRNKTPRRHAADPNGGVDLFEGFDLNRVRSFQTVVSSSSNSLAGSDGHLSDQISEDGPETFREHNTSWNSDNSSTSIHDDSCPDQLENLAIDGNESSKIDTMGTISGPDAHLSNPDDDERSNGTCPMKDSAVENGQELFDVPALTERVKGDSRSDTDPLSETEESVSDPAVDTCVVGEFPHGTFEERKFDESPPPTTDLVKISLDSNPGHLQSDDEPSKLELEEAPSGDSIYPDTEVTTGTTDAVSAEERSELRNVIFLNRQESFDSFISEGSTDLVSEPDESIPVSPSKSQEDACPFSDLTTIKETEPTVPVTSSRPPRPPSLLKTPTSYKSHSVEFLKAGDWPRSPSSVTGDTADSTCDSTGPDCESSIAGLSTVSTTSSQRRVRFADEEGMVMTKTYITERRDRFELNWNTAFVLLLAPSEKKFEVVHISYDLNDHLPLKKILRQLPDLAVTPELACQEYVGICRSRGEGVELLNLLSIQEVGFDRDEFLVAIPWGMTRKEIVHLANTLLADRYVLKRIKAYSRMDGFRLHKLHSTWRRTKKDDSSERLVDLPISGQHVPLGMAEF